MTIIIRMAVTTTDNCPTTKKLTHNPPVRSSDAQTPHIFANSIPHYMTQNNQTQVDVTKDLWLILSMAVASPEFLTLNAADRANIVNTVQHLHSLVNAS